MLLQPSKLSLVLLGWTAGCTLCDVQRAIPTHPVIKGFLTTCCALFTPSLNSSDLDQDLILQLQSVQWKRKALIGLAVFLVGTNWCRASYSYASQEATEDVFVFVALGLTWVSAVPFALDQKLIQNSDVCHSRSDALQVGKA